MLLNDPYLYFGGLLDIQIFSKPPIAFNTGCQNHHCTNNPCNNTTCVNDPCTNGECENC
jgi:hypothetical protein